MSDQDQEKGDDFQKLSDAAWEVYHALPEAERDAIDRDLKSYMLQRLASDEPDKREFGAPTAHRRARKTSALFPAFMRRRHPVAFSAAREERAHTDEILDAHELAAAMGIYVPTREEREAEAAKQENPPDSGRALAIRAVGNVPEGVDWKPSKGERQRIAAGDDLWREGRE